MPVTRIGLNLNATQNFTVQTFNSSKTATDYLREMPGVVNAATNYLYGWGVLLTMFIIAYSALSERFGNHGFDYDDGKAWAIASGITFIFGLLFVMVGYVQDFIAVGVMGGLFAAINLIIIYINNNGK